MTIKTRTIVVTVKSDESGANALRDAIAEYTTDAPAWLENVEIPEPVLLLDQNRQVTVGYFDAVHGGAGVTMPMPIEAVPMWLTEHPGYLIRDIVHADLRISADQREANVRAKHALGARLGSA